MTFTSVVLMAPEALAADLTGTARIVDGDTLEVDGQSIRLEGIDAPEMKQQCQDAAGKPFRCGRTAREALRKLANGPVTCSPSGKDRYGRVLAYCRAGDVDLNRRMVQDGWAFAFVKYNDRYAKDEIAAAKAKRGLWVGTAEKPWDWRAAQLAANAPQGDCVIKGNIARGVKTYYLPFHNAYKAVKINEANGERWFCTEGEALAAGWQRAHR